MSLIDESSRVALSAFLHDVGKLAERAAIDHGGRLDAHKTLYCPWHTEGGYHSHVHAAYTAMAWDELEAIDEDIGVRGLMEGRFQLALPANFLLA